MSPSRDLNFDEVADSLRHYIEEAISQCSTAELADNSSNVIRQVLKKHETRLETLFEAAKVHLQQVESTKSDSVYEDSLEQHRHLRAVVLGDGPAESRAKIFAVVLCARVSPASTVWSHFVQSLGSGDETRVHSGFRDTSLPFSDANLGLHFGEEYTQELREKQYELCPVDIHSRFSEPRESLRDFLNSEEDPPNLRICKKFDNEGNPLDHEPEDRFCPDEVTQEMIKKHAQSIKRLYVEGCKSQNASRTWSSAREQREFVKDAEARAEEFYEGVKPRAKLLATIVVAKVSAKSATWQQFSDICLGETSSIRPYTPEFCDESLPLDFNHMKKYLGSEHDEVLHNQQYRFCAVKLISEQQIDTKEKVRLPLLEKAVLNKGAFGTVYRVKVAAGYLKKTDKILAMKEMEMTPSNTVEWEDVQSLLQQQTMEHESIMQAVASLTTPEHIYIFFPLARCNLREYMTGKNFCAEGPGNFDQGMTYFNQIISIADALSFLHTILQSREERDRVVCIHGDLKAENILVLHDQDNKPFFQITDFGISSIKHHPKAPASYTIINGNQMISTQARSVRDMKTRTVLDNKCRNFAPEAITEDRQVDSSVDIWAFGTIFAEYIAWIAGGVESLTDYDQARGGSVDPAEREDFYLSFETKTIDGVHEVKVKDGIWSWYSKLIDSTRERDHADFYRNCEKLLKYHLLVCNSTYRARIETVCKILRKTWRRENVDIEGMARDRHTDKTSNESTELPHRDKQRAPSNTSVETESVPEKVDTEAPSSPSKPSPREVHPPPTTTSPSTQSEPVDHNKRTSLLVALVEKNEARASQLLNSGSRLDFPDKNKWTALHLAVRWASLNFMKRILDIRPDLVNEMNADGHTALHLCAMQSTKDAVQCVRLLLERGADPNIKDRAERTAVYFATDEQPNGPRITMVNLLLAGGADVKSSRRGSAEKKFEAVQMARRG